MKRIVKKGEASVAVTDVQETDNYFYARTKNPVEKFVDYEVLIRVKKEWFWFTVYSNSISINSTTTQKPKSKIGQIKLAMEEEFVVYQLESLYEFFALCLKHRGK